MNPPEWIAKATAATAQARASYEQLNEQALLELAKVTDPAAKAQTLATLAVAAAVVYAQRMSRRCE
jgi:hypothetical protein